MANPSQSIKVVSYALDELPNGEIVLRGVIDPDSLAQLCVAKYQREILSPKKVDQLVDAMSSGSVPDIVLGMRGEQFFERNGALYLQDAVFIIDGLQRRTAAMKLMQLDPGSRPHLGATIHFNTTEVIEREMFEKLNLGQTKLSSNVHLRNLAEKNPAIAALLKVTDDKGFALSGAISWDQNMTRGKLMTATTFTKTAAMLHSHAGPGRSSQVLDVANGLSKIMENVGRPAFVDNVKAFYAVLDQCFGVRRVTFVQGATFLKANFLTQLARVLSDHTNFWQGDRLVVEASLVKKIAAFPVDDPEIMRLAAGSGTTGDILYWQLVKHINSGKRTRRLVSRRQLHDRPIEDGAGDVGYEAEEEVTA
jgi:hypothetical protein